MINKIMDSMGLTEKEISFLRDNKHIESIEGTVKGIWQVVEDASEYAFNASHSYAVTLDSLYTAWVKAHYPLNFYTVTLEMFSNEKDTEKVAKLKEEAFRYAGIKIVPMRYGQDNRSFKGVEETNSIWQSLLSVKGINANTAQIIYEIGQEYPNIDNFFDLYIIMKERKLTKTHISNMLKINFFSDIVEKRKGLALVEYFDVLNKKQVKKDKISELYEGIKEFLPMNILELYTLVQDMASKETPKMFKLDVKGDECSPLVKVIFDKMKVTKTDRLEEYYWEYSLFGTVMEKQEDLFVGTVIKFNPKTNKIVFKDVSTGEESWMAINDNQLVVKEKNIVFIETFTTKKYRGKTYYTIEQGHNLTTMYK